MEKLFSLLDIHVLAVLLGGGDIASSSALRRSKRMVSAEELTSKMEGEGFRSGFTPDEVSEVELSAAIALPELLWWVCVADMCSLG